MFRVNGADELPDDLTGIVGVTAGASAPEAAGARRSSPASRPAEGVEEVRITDEDEYFPPPRNLRDLLAGVDVLATFSLGGSVRRPARASRDRAASHASDVLAAPEPRARPSG